MRAHGSDPRPWLLTGLGLLFIGAATLTPTPLQSATAATTPIWCIVCGDHGGVDVVVNVMLFIPFAFGLRAAGVALWRVIAIGALVSVAVESLQLTVIPGRDASLSDVLTNTLGSVFGASLGSRAGALTRPTREQAIRLTALAGGFWLGTQVISGALLQPWTPSSPLWVAWGRRIPGRTAFDGRVTAASVSGASVSNGSFITTPEFRSALLRKDALLQVAALAGRAPRFWVPVVELLGPHGPLTGLEVGSRDVVFHPPSRAYLLRLRGPALRLPDGPPPSPGDSLSLAGGASRRTVWVTSLKSGSTYRRSLALSPSFGWSLVVPFDYAYGPEVHILTGLWLAGLLLPFGYWSAGAGLRSTGLFVKWAALLLAGLGLVPLLGGYPVVHWSEWVGGGVGLGVGWASHGIAAYFGGRCDSPSIRESCSF